MIDWQHARLLATAGLFLLSAAAGAQGPSADELSQRVERLERRLGQLESLSDREPPASVTHLAGYGSAGYTDAEGAPGAFDSVSFSPIFHFMYRDLLLFESEFDFSVDDDGETETQLEYATLDLFMNDYAVLVAGKFLSPIGQFRQNLHPAWINKLPSAPPGFAEGGAAPITEVGIQVRGGFLLADRRSNYALYLGNGPRAQVDGGAISVIDAEGATSNRNGHRVWGGRVAVLPWPQFELGISGALGKAGLFDAGQQLESGRNYDVLGADFVYHLSLLEFRGEYVRQRVSPDRDSTAPGEFKSIAWYGQAAYLIAPSRWEAVLRLGDFDTPSGVTDQRQWAAGLDYWFAGNVVGKVAYEWNDGQSGTASDNDRVLLQLAYGL